MSLPVELAEVALGKRDPDLIVTGGRYLNVFTGEILPADVWVYRGRIAKIKHNSAHEGSNAVARPAVKVVDAENRVILPGFIDGHIHIESSLLDPVGFAELALPFGVTTVVTDFHEIATVLGADGIRACLAAGAGTPLNYYLLVPRPIPFVPAFEQTLARLDVEDILELLQEPEALGLSEIIGAEAAFPSESQIRLFTAALAAGKTLEGHLFFTRGDELDSCIVQGISSDHEPRKRDEVVEKLRKGLFVMLRKGSLAREVDTLVGVLSQQGLPVDRVGMVTDDILPGDIIRQEYMASKLRVAVDNGISPVDAVRMVTCNVARHYGIDSQVGCIRPGGRADLVLVSDLETFSVEMVIAGGDVVARDGALVKPLQPYSYPSGHLQTIPRRHVNPDDFRLVVPGEDREVEARAIRLNEKNRFTELVDVQLERKSGELLIPPDADLNYIACINRRTDDIGTGLLADYGLQQGAIAVSISHDHHNIVAVGKSKQALSQAVNRLIDLEGGIVFASAEQVVHEFPLPLGGLMSTRPPAEVMNDIETLQRLLRQNGVRWQEALFFLFFLAMPVAPYYRITDRGVLDVEAGRFVPVIT